MPRLATPPCLEHQNEATDCGNPSTLGRQLQLWQGSHYFSPTNSGSKKTSHVAGRVLKGIGTQYISTQYTVYYIYIIYVFSDVLMGLIIKGVVPSGGFSQHFPDESLVIPSFRSSEVHIIRSSEVFQSCSHWRCWSTSWSDR